MTALAREIEMVRDLVPDVEERMLQFEVAPFELDEELVSAFHEELERLSGEMQAGLDASEDEPVRLAAHSIKGMSGTMGLPEISVLAREIELTLRAGERERFLQLSNALIRWARELTASGD